MLLFFPDAICYLSGRVETSTKHSLLGDIPPRAYKLLSSNLCRVPEPQAALQALVPLVSRVVLVGVEPQLVFVLEGLPALRANTRRLYNTFVNPPYVRVQVILFGEPLWALGWNSIHLMTLQHALEAKPAQ